MKNNIGLYIGLAVIALFIGFIFFDGCTDDEVIVENKYNDNIIVLLDLSDRIVKKSNQIGRDKLFITNVFNAVGNSFKYKLQNTKLNKINDKCKLLVAKQSKPDISLIKNEVESTLRFDFSKMQMKDLTYITHKKYETDFKNSIDELYNVAYVGNDRDEYSGSAWWDFFLNDYDKHTSSDNGNTYIFVITDGQFYANGSAEFPQLSESSFSENTHIMFLEVYPKNDIDANSFQSMKNKLIDYVSPLANDVQVLRYDLSEADVIDQINKFMNTKGVVITQKPPVDDSLNTGNNEVTIIKEPTQKTETEEKGESKKKPTTTSCSPNITSLKAKDFKSNNTPVFFYTSEGNLTNEMKALDFITKVNTLRLSGKYNSAFKIKDCVKEAGKITRLEVIGDMKYKN